MLKSIHIQGFKGFRNLKISDLKKVNLILGGQNVGKTSLLEAIYMGGVDLGMVRSLGSIFRDGDDKDHTRFWDGLFKEQLFISLVESRDASLVTAFASSDKVKINLGAHGVVLGSISGTDARHGKRIIQLGQDLDGLPQVFHEIEKDLSFFSPLPVSIYPLGQVELAQLFDKVVFSRKKKDLLRMLNYVEPRLEDIHSLSPDKDLRIYLELDGLDTALPLPQMGHGFGRLVNLYCSLLVTKAKLALIDEVENGIHYSSLPTVFKGVRGISFENDVQTLMTTHSWDAIRSACEVFSDCPDMFQVIRLERTEDDNVKAVCIEGERMLRMMDREMEVR